MRDFQEKLRIGLAATLLIFYAGSVSAACMGRDLMADLPKHQRASLDEIIKSDPFANGNFWRAEKHEQVIDLIGTMHLPDPRSEQVLTRAKPLLAQAKHLLVEATPDQMAALRAQIAQDPQLLFRITGPTLPEILSPQEWARLKTTLSVRGIPPFLAAKMQPWYLSMLLQTPPCLANATQGTPSSATLMSGMPPGLDALLMAEAQRRALPLTGLEPPETTLQAMASLTLDQQLAMLRAELSQNDQADDLFATMTDAYFRGEHRLIWEFNRQRQPDSQSGDFTQVESLLLDQRNVLWIPQIIHAAQTGPVVVAVGAAHLSGPMGLLELLHQQGFALRQIDP